MLLFLKYLDHAGQKRAHRVVAKYNAFFDTLGQYEDAFMHAIEQFLVINY